MDGSCVAHPQRGGAQRVDLAAAVVLVLGQGVRGLVGHGHAAGAEGDRGVDVVRVGADEAARQLRLLQRPHGLAVQLDPVLVGGAGLEVADLDHAVVVALDRERGRGRAQHAHLAAARRSRPRPPRCSGRRSAGGVRGRVQASRRWYPIAAGCGVKRGCGWAADQQLCRQRLGHPVLDLVQRPAVLVAQRPPHAPGGSPRRRWSRRARGSCPGRRWRCSVEVADQAARAGPVAPHALGHDLGDARARWGRRPRAPPRSSLPARSSSSNARTICTP